MRCSLGLGRGRPWASFCASTGCPSASPMSSQSRIARRSRVMLLCEELVAFRDSNGKVGLLDNNCPHRRASLFFGRNEEFGLRCVYHGWKFDVSGDCVDMPSEPAGEQLQGEGQDQVLPRGGARRHHVDLHGSPARPAPGLPELPSNMIDDVVVSAYMRPCNWMQALEGDIDTVHTLVPAPGPHPIPRTRPRAAGRGGTFRIARPTTRPSTRTSAPCTAHTGPPWKG